MAQHNKRVHTERRHTLSFLIQSPMPSGDAHDVRPQQTVCRGSMGYKSDHGFRTELWDQVTSGLPNDLKRQAHEHLGKNYREEKDEMEYGELLEVVKEVMSDYPEWSWNGRRWYQ
jgi:hypothetical protein